MNEFLRVLKILTLAQPILKYVKCAIKAPLSYEGCILFKDIDLRFSGSLLKRCYVDCRSYIQWSHRCISQCIKNRYVYRALLNNNNKLLHIYTLFLAVSVDDAGSYNMLFSILLISSGRCYRTNDATGGETQHR